MLHWGEFGPPEGKGTIDCYVATIFLGFATINNMAAVTK